MDLEQKEDRWWDVLSALLRPERDSVHRPYTRKRGSRSKVHKPPHRRHKRRLKQENIFAYQRRKARKAKRRRSKLDRRRVLYGRR